MSDVNTPGPAVAPEVALTPVHVTPIDEPAIAPTPAEAVSLAVAPAVAPVVEPTIASAVAVDDAQTASDRADAEHATLAVAATHPIQTSLLHSASTYIESVLASGAKHIDQIVSSRE
jgi:hypothetical protein